MSASTQKGCLSTQEVADGFGLNVWTVRLVVDRLGLDRRVGRNRVVLAADLPKLEIAFRTLGHAIPPFSPPQPAEEGVTWK
jgi:hypothetical protein